MTKPAVRAPRKRSAAAAKAGAVVAPYVEYSPELAGRFVLAVMEGASVKSICRLEGMPSERSISVWAFKHPEFRKAYHEARNAGVERYAADLVALADECPVDKMAILKARLQIEVRKHVLAKLRPKEWGESLDVVHGGSVNVTLRRFGDPNVSAEDIAKRVNEAVALAKVVTEGNG